MANRLTSSMKTAHQANMSIKNDASKLLKDFESTQKQSIVRLDTTESTFDTKASVILDKLLQQQADGTFLLVEATLARDSFSNWDERFHGKWSKHPNPLPPGSMISNCRR